MNLNLDRNISRKTVAILLLVIAVLGSVTVYDTLLLGGVQPKSLGVTSQVYASPVVVQDTGAALDPVQIYAMENSSVVTVSGDAYSLTQTYYGPMNVSGQVLGTGWVISYSNSYYIITNFHVVDGMVNDTVTFSNGDAYQAQVVGTDPYSDLAVVSVKSAPQSEFHPIQLGASSSLKVGESVVAIGSPYGLSGTITVGVVSQVGRTLQEGTLGGYAIPDTVQFSAPINPGNSGGPLLNPSGLVVGITTATATDSSGGSSQGLGFAIPSDTIAREVPYLVHDGSYNKHPYVGVSLADMNYQLAQVTKSGVTWGVLVQSTVQGGPADQAGIKAGSQNVTVDGQQYTIGGDVIVSLDGTRIVNYDAFSAYLETHATPSQTLQVGIIRQGKQMTIQLQLGTRPPMQLDLFNNNQPPTFNNI
jgi:S1-C subfamily serine protease